MRAMTSLGAREGSSLSSSYEIGDIAVVVGRAGVRGREIGPGAGLGPCAIDAANVAVGVLTLGLGALTTGALQEAVSTVRTEGLWEIGTGRA